MSGQHNKYERRAIRRLRIRKRVQGSVERPRLSVFRSGKHIYAQVIDDLRGATLVAASSRESLRAKEKGIMKVAFDRGGYRYHGRVKALADGARAGGLEF